MNTRNMKTDCSSSSMIGKECNAINSKISPATLLVPVSPPLRSCRVRKITTTTRKPTDSSLEEKLTQRCPPLSAIEAGEAKIRDHLIYFSQQLHALVRPQLLATNASPRLPIAKFRDLYKRNQHAHGRHFVIHQHDHPVAGMHYDLRLQISECSSISFAIMYGLPGNVGSKRLNRNATETRVHNLWVWDAPRCSSSLVYCKCLTVLCSK